MWYLKFNVFWIWWQQFVMLCRASDKCQKEKRKTVNGDDLLWAMATLGFEDYIAPLKAYLARYREVVANLSCPFFSSWNLSHYCYRICSLLGLVKLRKKKEGINLFVLCFTSSFDLSLVAIQKFAFIQLWSFKRVIGFNLTINTLFCFLFDHFVEWLWCYSWRYVSAFYFKLSIALFNFV